MSKKEIKAIDELFAGTIVENIIVVATKGDKKRIYSNVKTWDTVQKIIDYRKSEGWDVKVTN